MKDESNHFVKLAVQQHLLLWELTQSMLEIERSLADAIETTQAPSKTKKMKGKNIDHEPH